MHGVALAEELGVRHVIVPVNSSAFSAWGMLLSDLRRDYLRTSLTDLAPGAQAAIEALFAELEADAARDFAEDGAARAPVFERFADMRYQGQEHSVKVPLAGGGGLAGLIERFHAAHEKRYTYRLDNAVQLVNAHLVARVEVAKPTLPERPVTGASLDDARRGARQVSFDRAGTHEAAIYDGLALEPGMAFAGPAVVQEPSATLVVPPGGRVSIDRFGNYHVHLGAEG
jgi:N-methylhydantoinase A